MGDIPRAEDLAVGWRARRLDATLSKTAENVWQGDGPCRTDRWVNEWLGEGTSLLPPLDVGELRAALARFSEDPARSPVLRARARSAAISGRPEDRVWPASLHDCDIRAALWRSIVGGCRPGPLKALFPDAPEKLRAWLERNRAVG